MGALDPHRNVPSCTGLAAEKRKVLLAAIQCRVLAKYQLSTSRDPYCSNLLPSPTNPLTRVLLQVGHFGQVGHLLSEKPPQHLARLEYSAAMKSVMVTQFLVLVLCNYQPNSHSVASRHGCEASP